MKLKWPIVASYHHQQIISIFDKNPPFLWVLSVMETKHALLFFVFQWTIYSRVFAADEDSTSHSGYFITRENKRLTGHVVQWFESPSLVSCSQSCLRNAWCSSTNFKASSKEDGRGKCELNKHDSSHINENTKLNEQQGVTFSILLKARYLILKKLCFKKTTSWLILFANFVTTFICIAL